jgi:nucleoid-associated protein YgaU
MAPVKLEIRAESGPSRFDQRITALFNPNQIAIQKTVNWQSAPTPGRDVTDSQFTHGDPAILTMDLFFDTYEDGSDVRGKTDPIVHLTTVEKHGNIHRPPICQLAWGQWGVFFQGVLKSLNQRFTLFLGDGTPARATLSCTFQEWRSSDDDARLQNKQSVDVAKTRVVRRGDSLSSLAAEEYSDPSLWRPIAEANGIDDPRALQPGRVLAIPALRPASIPPRGA